MPKAIWNGTVIAESDDTEIVEGNHYFPPDSIRKEHFRDSTTETVCGCSGKASRLLTVNRLQVRHAAADRKAGGLTAVATCQPSRQKPQPFRAAPCGRL